MQIDKPLPPDLRTLTRLIGTHAECGNRTRCIQKDGDPNDWTILTTESPSDAARFARCLMGCKVSIADGGERANVVSGENRIEIVRHGFDINA